MSGTIGTCNPAFVSSTVTRLTTSQICRNLPHYPSRLTGATLPLHACRRAVRPATANGGRAR
jgi:hypothetical protein